MNKDRIENGIKEIEQIAKNIGLDFIPVIFETVTRDIMLEACSYGLPVRARHWSYGKSYDHQKIFGEMGYSKVYEVVFNNDPSYAFLLDTNPDIINLMVIAHVFGHSHFFKNNVMFKNSDRNMVHCAAERAARVDDYIMQYGVDKVEHIMDIAFALDNHIDWNKGLFRKRYPQKSTVNENIVRGEFDDLLGGSDNRSIKKKVINDNFPPKPERDLLWFLSNYAQLEDWERDILTIVREESYYFYPIVTTKILNEGLAVFIHAEIMNMYEGMSEDEFIEFCKCHSGVVNPGSQFSINPYYIGFKILMDIRKKWDKLFNDGESEINGIQKIIKVAAEEDDASFLRNYLTVELAEDMGLFNYGYKHKRPVDIKEHDLGEKYGIIELKDRDLQVIIENIIRPTINYGAPLIEISDASSDTLSLSHIDDFGPLDEKYTEKTMSFIYELWGGPVELKTSRGGLLVRYYYDESGFDIL